MSDKANKIIADIDSVVGRSAGPSFNDPFGAGGWDAPRGRMYIAAKIASLEDALEKQGKELALKKEVANELHEIFKDSINYLAEAIRGAKTTTTG